MGKGTHLQF